MKKILLAVNILLLGVIISQSRSSYAQKNPQKIPTTEIKRIDECQPQSLNINYDTFEDDGGLNAYLAQELSESYAKDGFKGFMNSSNGMVSRANKPDTRSIWFDLARLKNLIHTIEKSVCERNCQTPLNLGLRIYLAKYKPVTGRKATIEDMTHVSEAYANRTTVFMVGTYDNANGMHIDFDPMNVGSNKCVPISFKKLMDSLRSTDFRHKLKVGSLKKSRNVWWTLEENTGTNMGDLNPPPSGSGTFPTDY